LHYILVFTKLDFKQWRGLAWPSSGSPKLLLLAWPTTTTEMEESPRVSDGGATDKERVMRLLEREAASAKQREMMKMLESLVQQTKELE